MANSYMPDCKAVLYSTLSPDWLKATVFPHYGLSSDDSCVLFHRGLNDTYLVSGSKGQLALRVYRSRWRTKDEVFDEIEALQFAHAAGISVATPISRTDGELVTILRAPEGDRCVVLFTWIYGEELRYDNPEHAKQSGSALARLHNATSALAQSKSRPTLNLNHLLDRPLRYLEPALRGRPPARAYFESLAKRIRSYIHAKQGDMDWGFCHGDFHNGNALSQIDNITMFDFDCCGSGWRTYDLATYKWAAQMRRMEDQAWKPFVNSYSEIRPEMESSLHFIPVFMVLRHLWLMGYHAWNAEEIGTSFLTDTFINNLIDYCNQAEGEGF